MYIQIYGTRVINYIIDEKTINDLQFILVKNLVIEQTDPMEYLQLKIHKTIKNIMYIYILNEKAILQGLHLKM